MLNQLIRPYVGMAITSLYPPESAEIKHVENRVVFTITGYG